MRLPGLHPAVLTVVLVTCLVIVGCGDDGESESDPTPCGDGVAGDDEVCDGTDLGGHACSTVGFADGTLACTSDCDFDTRDCRNLLSETPPPETFVCVGGSKSGITCDPNRDPNNPNVDCAFCTDGGNDGQACTSDVPCGLGHCRGQCESSPSDAVGNPYRYTLFRQGDRIQLTKLVEGGNPGAKCTSLVESGAPGTCSADGTCSFSSSFAFPADVMTRDNAQTRGRFVDPMKEKVLGAWIEQSTLVVDQRRLDDNPGPLLPRYIQSSPVGDIRVPFALAAGDADRLVGVDKFFHDEAVLAFSSSSGSITVSVLDYMRQSGSVAVTSVNLDAFGRLSIYRAVQYGGLAVGVGDFDGDGGNEIAVTFQTSGTGTEPLGVMPKLVILRYTNDGTSTPTLTVVKDIAFAPDTVCGDFPVGCPSAIYPGLDMAVGNLDLANFNEEIAISFLGVSADDHKVRPAILLVGLDATFAIVARFIVELGQDVPGRPPVTYTLLPSNRDTVHFMPRSMRPRLATGLFAVDESGDLSPHHLAVAYWGDQTTGIYIEQMALARGPQPPPGFPQVYALLPTRLSYGYNLSAYGWCAPHKHCACGGGFDGAAYGNACVPSLSMSAGNLRHTAQDESPLWDVAVNASLVDQNNNGTSEVNLWLSGTSPLQLNQLDGGDRCQTSDVTVVDADGKSLLLGTPVRIIASQVVATDVMFYEPPKHVDWFPGLPPSQASGCVDPGFCNVSRKSGIQVRLADVTQSTFSQKTTTSSSFTFGATQSLDSNFNVAQNFVVAGVNLDLGLKLKFDENFDSKESSYEQSSTTYTYVQDGATTADDLISGSLRDTVIFRYPILNLTLDPPPAPGARFATYEVHIPGNVSRFAASGGLNFDFYQPRHENGNVLSYPPISLQGGVELNPEDMGGYSFRQCSNTTCAGGSRVGQACTADSQCSGSACLGAPCMMNSDCAGGASCASKSLTEPLFNQSYFMDATIGETSFTIAEAMGGGRTRESTHRYAFNQDVTSSIYTKAGAPPFATVKNKVSIDFGFSETSSVAHGEESSHQTTSSQAFTLQRHCGDPQVACVESDQAYEAATAYYYGRDGSQKVVHAVDLQQSQAGRDFWRSRYAGRPDPALNLPQRVTMQIDTPHWNPNPTHQLLRGFAVLHAPDDERAVENDVPVSRPIVVGDKIKLAVPVYNYSLDTAASGVEVYFFAIAVDSSSGTLLGMPAIPLCTVGTDCPRIGTLAARDVVTVTLIVDTTRLGPGTREYRIGVVLDPRNTIPNEIHEWQDRYGCMPSYGGQVIIDPLTGVPETLETGQNNQGYGGLLVLGNVPNNEPGVGLSADVLLQDGAISVRQGGAELQGSGEVLFAGEPAEVRVEVATDDHSLQPHWVVLTEGDLDAGGPTIGAKLLRGIDAGHGGYAWFHWTPPAPGTYRLHARVLEHAFDPVKNNNVQTLAVQVTEPPIQGGVDQGCIALATPTPSPTQTHTSTRTLPPTATFTFTATYTLVPTLTATATATLTRSPSPTITNTPTATLTPTRSPSATPTYTVTPSPTTSGTATPTMTLTPTPEPSATATNTRTLSPTRTSTATRTTTRTATPTNTRTATRTATSSRTPSPTRTATSTPTVTATPTVTSTPTVTQTPTPQPSATPTNSPTGTRTPTQTATPTFTATGTSTRTPTFSPSATIAPSPTNTPIPTSTRTATPAATPTNTLLATPTVTSTPGSFFWRLDGTPTTLLDNIPLAGESFSNGRLDLVDPLGRFCTTAGTFPVIQIEVAINDLRTIGVYPGIATQTANIAALPAAPAGLYDVIVQTFPGCDGSNTPIILRMPDAVRFVAP